MPNQKISQLSDGNAAQAADEFLIARSGDNYRVAGTDVAAAATALGPAATAVDVSGTAIRVDTVGNVGFGITPNAITGASATYKHTQGLGWSLITPQNGGADTFALTCGAYNSTGGTYNYRATGQNVGMYQIFAGVHIWSVGPAGTLGATISFPHFMRLDQNGNLAVGTTTVGTNAERVLALGNAVEPITGPANTVQVYSVDLSAGNTIPAVYCEGSGVTGAGITNTTVTHKVALKVNGTVYYLLATTDNT